MLNRRRKLWFLTRSYLPTVSGGSLVRAAQVRHLSQIFDISVVVSDDGASDDDSTIRIPPVFPFGSREAAVIGEKLGIYDDYLDLWVKSAFLQLKKLVRPTDVLFATTGGELGMIKLGVMLKEYAGCRLVINFHDPIDYATLNGMIVDRRFHVNRDKIESKLLMRADLMLTSSHHYQQSLIKKYPRFSDRILTWYFGFDFPLQELPPSTPRTRLRIGYAGSFSPIQSPDVLARAIAKATDLQDKITVVYVGDYRSKDSIELCRSCPWVEIRPAMSHPETLKFFSQNIDVGFASLLGDYFGACVPSKIYDYIGLGLPIIGLLPEGDAKNIVVDNGFGQVCAWQQSEMLVEAIRKFLEPNCYSLCLDSLRKKREFWSMEATIKPVHQWLMERL